MLSSGADLDAFIKAIVLAANLPMDGKPRFVGGYNVWCRDFRPHEYEQWAAEHPHYAQTLPTARSGHGVHVFLRLTDESTRGLLGTSR
jgi:hypothetical protein